MAYSTQRAVSDGTMTYLDLSINYQSRNDIKVFFDDLPAAAGSWSWVGTTDKRINFTTAVANGVEVLVQRTTRIDRIINRFVNGAKFNNNTMDMNFEQVLFLTQEAVEGSALSDIFNDVDFHGYKIKNLGTAVDDNDAVSLGQIRADSTTATGAAANAKVSETNAKTSETNAAASAAAAASSATAAAGSATASATSATASQTSRLASESARDAAIQARNDAQAAAAPATELVNQVNANKANIAATTNTVTMLYGLVGSSSTDAGLSTAPTPTNNFNQFRVKVARGILARSGSTNGPFTLLNFDAVMNATTLGPNGQDGTLTAATVNTGCFIYLIYGESGQVALVATCNETGGPTLTNSAFAGYTYAHPLGLSLWAGGAQAWVSGWGITGNRSYWYANTPFFSASPMSVSTYKAPFLDPQSWFTPYVEVALIQSLSSGGYGEGQCGIACEAWASGVSAQYEAIAVRAITQTAGTSYGEIRGVIPRPPGSYKIYGANVGGSVTGWSLTVSLKALICANGAQER